MQKLKKGDEVIITAGKDQGKRGKIEKVYIASGTVLLPGLNIFKRHLKKRDDKNPGGIVDLPRPLPVGNVSLICPKCGKPTRVGFDTKGKQKIRVCAKCDARI